MGLPCDVALRVSDDEVGVVRGGETDESFPSGFVVVDRHEVRLLRGGHILAHAVKDHRPDKPGGALEFGNLEIGDACVSVVIGGNVFVPVPAKVTTFVREADHKDENLLPARDREKQFRAVEGLRLYGGDSLGGGTKNGEEKREEEGRRKTLRVHESSLKFRVRGLDAKSGRGGRKAIDATIAPHACTTGQSDPARRVGTTGLGRDRSKLGKYADYTRSALGAPANNQFTFCSSLCFACVV